MIRETVWYKRNIDCLPTVTNFLTGLTLKVILFETFDYSVLMRNQLMVLFSILYGKHLNFMKFDLIYIYV